MFAVSRDTVCSRLPLAAALVLAVGCGPSLGQTSDLPALVEQLESVQQANLALARKIAAIQVASAETMRKAINDGQLPSTLSDDAAVIADNAATLAVISLAPIGTRAEATGDTYLRLLRQNVSQLDELISRSADPGALSVLRAVRESQLETESLFAGLEDSWTQYQHALRLAELDGTLPVGTFDPASRRWAFPHSAPQTAPNDMTRLPPLPREGTSAAAQLTEESDVAPNSTASSSASEAWVVTTDRNGLPAATANNVDDESRERLTSITIGCNFDGTLRYRVEGSEALREIAVVFGDNQRAFVAVENGAIVGSQALRMSDSLRLAYEWAEAEQSSTMAIGTPNDPSLTAAMPVANYYQARGAVLDSCLPYDEEAIATPATSDSNDEPVAPIPFPRPPDRMPD